MPEGTGDAMFRRSDLAFDVFLVSTFLSYRLLESASGSELLAWGLADRQTDRHPGSTAAARTVCFPENQQGGTGNILA